MSIRRLLHYAGSTLVLAAGVVVSSSSPAQAQIPTCTGSSGLPPGGLPPLNITQLTPCQIGDKIYSNFQAVQGTLGSNALFSFSEQGADHTLNVSTLGTAFGPGTYQFQYTVTVAAPSSRLIESFRTSASASGTTGNVFVKSLSVAAGATPLQVDYSNLSIGPSSPLASFSPEVSSAVFTSTLIVTSGSVNQFTDSLTQTAEVPGPLPLLGASVAFGFSRKLRRRLTATA